MYKSRRLQGRLASTEEFKFQNGVRKIFRVKLMSVAYYISILLKVN